MAICHEYIVLCSGGVGLPPNLTFTFDQAPNEEGAVEYAKRSSLLIASENIWRFALFRKDTQNTQKFIAEWEVQRRPTIMDRKHS
jgi:hypothetical protein